MVSSSNSIDLAWLVCGELLCGKGNQGVSRSRELFQCVWGSQNRLDFFCRWMANGNENSPTDRRLEILRSCGGKTLFIEQAWLRGDDKRC